MLAVTEANNAGYDEAILLTPEGTVADGSGENIFVVRDGVIYTPDLSTGILPGITRDTVKQIAADLGYTVVEKSLIRSDLYLADEVFMCGTAAEVTPLRADRRPRDRRRRGDARDPEGVPRDRARPDRALVALARAGAAARAQLTTAHEQDQPQRAVDRRARRGARARGAPLGLALARADGCTLRVAVRGCGRRAALRRGLVGNGGPASVHAPCRGRGGGRGDHVALLVRRVGELRDLRRRDAGLRRYRPEHPQPRSGGGRGSDHTAHKGARGRRHLRLPGGVRRADLALRTTWDRADRGLRARRSARRTRGSRSVRTGTLRSGPSTRTSR